MAAATVLTGLVAGACGAALTVLLHLVQHVAFGYTENTFLRGVEHASPARRVLAMTVGGVVAGLGWWLHRRSPQAEHVSVTGALRHPDPRLPVLATVRDAVLQIVAVGVGASLGREGAPRQVGAASAGWIAARFGLSDAQRRTLLACGAGAGLAAVYNVPLGGAVFSVELLMRSGALRDILPAAATAAIATVVAWPVLSNHSTYRLAAAQLHPPVLVWAVLAGPLIGLGVVGFVRLMDLARLHAARGWRLTVAIPVVFAAVGALAIGYPQVLGNGKGPAELALTGTMSVGLAAVLLLLKPLATAACLGSGAIGGLLTPSFATGAVLGVATGGLWTLLWPGSAVAEYAIVGAATLLAVTQRAPLTAVVLTLEFIGTGQALLAPMLTSIGLAIATAMLLDPSMTPAVVDAVRTRGRSR